VILSDIDISALVINSGKAVLYAFITIALAYIYSTKRKGFFLLIVSFALLTLSRTIYVVQILTDLSGVYYLSIYYFAVAFLAIGALQYNQKINAALLGFITASCFCIVVHFLPDSAVRTASIIYSVTLHVVILTSFVRRSDKNVGDLFIIVGVFMSASWLLIRGIKVPLLINEPLLMQVISDFINSIGSFGLTVGLLLRIILEHRMELKLLTLKDDLSGLANRRALNGYVDQLVLIERPFQLALIRIRGIRQLNENYGHQAGDEALFNISSKLQSCLVNEQKNRDEQSYLARLNGNYLVFINNDSEKFSHIETLLSSCVEQCSSRNTYLQVGIANYPHHGSQFVEILTAAEIVLSECKKESTNCVHQIDTLKLQEYRQQQLMAKALAQAISNEEIEVCYQPKYTLSTNVVSSHNEKPSLVSAEALARWTYQGERISPFLFIKLAEDYDLIADLDALVMKKAWFKADEMNKQGHSMRIAVNYSSTSLSEKGGLNTLVRHLMSKYLLKAKHLEIEITESAMAQSSNTQEQLKELRAQGFTIAIDDFGTGFSNLSQLQALPLDTLKVDKAFVDLIATNPLVTEFIIDMAHKLKLNIVAEGVELDEQLLWLQHRGCHQIQGYLLSKPLSENDFNLLINQPKM
jgi:diguanylate cyclase (GGDEF)-like protein